MELKVIAHIENDYTDKFGIPRQPGLADVPGRIVFEPEYRREEAVRGLDGFDYVWLIWGFHKPFAGTEAKRYAPPETAETIDAGDKAESAEGSKRNEKPNETAAANGASDTPEMARSWSPTVRPPRLGGNRRVGVFASRSPNRPNPIGLSAVRLLRVEDDPTLGPVLWVTGADLLNGSPVYDIKPYVPLSDAHPEARGGFTEENSDYELDVVFPEELIARIPEEKRNGLLGVLRQDPRPSYQDDPERVYGLAFGGWNIRFTVRGKILTVREVKVTDEARG